MTPSKKSFKGVNPALAFITQDVQDTQQVQDAQLTQGKQLNKKPSEKLPRINMAFTHDHLEYLQIMSGFKGMSITAYVNQLIEMDMKHNDKTIAQLKQLKGSK